MDSTLRKCPSCGYAKTLCGKHGVCSGCDEDCNPIAKSRKIICVGTCGAQHVWRRGKELKCKKCGMVYLEGTKTKDGWRNTHMPADFQEIRKLESELATLKGKKKPTTKQQEQILDLEETIPNRKEKAEYIDVIVDIDGIEYLINYQVPSDGTMRCDLTVWPVREAAPIAYLTRCDKFEGSSATRRMIMATKKATKKSGKRGRNSAVAGQRVYKALDNPYREGTHIAKTFSKITNGMSVEKVRELTRGKSIEFHTMFNHGAIVVTDSKTKPTASTISRLRAKQAKGVTGKGVNHLRDSSGKAKKATKKVAKKKATKKAKKTAKRKATKKSKKAKTAKRKTAKKVSASKKATEAF